MSTHTAHGATDTEQAMRAAGVKLIDIDKPPRRRREKSPPEKFILGAIASLGLTLGLLMIVIGLSADPEAAVFGAVVFGLGWSAMLAWLIVGALRSR